MEKERDKERRGGGEVDSWRGGIRGRSKRKRRRDECNRKWSRLVARTDKRHIMEAAAIKMMIQMLDKETQ